MDKKTIIGYALVAGISAGITYLLTRPPVGTPLTAQPPSAPQAQVATRWTSGYMGPTTYGGVTNIYPEAGVAEALYPYGEMHKITQFAPYATAANSGAAANGGSLIMID